jgi:hypothetical protein
MFGFGIQKQEDELIRLIRNSKKRSKKVVAPVLVALIVAGFGLHFLTSSRAEPSVPTPVNDTNFSYIGDWQWTRADGAFDGDQHMSLVVNGTASLKFDGTSVSLYGLKAPDQGIAAVSIDDGPEQLVDMYAAIPAYQTILYSNPTLKDGPHTIYVRVTGNKNSQAAGMAISLDRAEIVGSLR